MNINFSKVVGESTVLNPMNNFAPERHIIEYRIDPLTGQACFLNLTMVEKRLKLRSSFDEGQLDEIVEKTREACFMCPENVDKVTPKYPPEILPEGRLQGTGAILFPNMFAISKFSAVAALKSHYLRLTEYSPDVLLDIFMLALQFIRRIHEMDSSAEYAVIGCNYLFPAGGSGTHPHIHVFLDEMPFNSVKTLLNSSKRYFDEHHNNYWDDLIEAEKKEGERYLGNIGNTEWLVPFAPSGTHEIQAVIRNKSDFLECTEADMASLSQGLSRVLKYYGEQGVYSFNYIIFSGPLGKRVEYLYTGLKIISRFFYPPANVSDVNWRFRLGERCELYIETPEMVANLLRKKFNPWV